MLHFHKDQDIHVKLNPCKCSSQKEIFLHQEGIHVKESLHQIQFSIKNHFSQGKSMRDAFVNQFHMSKTMEH